MSIYDNMGGEKKYDNNVVWIFKIFDSQTPANINDNGSSDEQVNDKEADNG